MDVIQVLTREPIIYGNDHKLIGSAGMSSYIGDLDASVADVLINPISRGLLRLEGFIQRLQPEAV